MKNLSGNILKMKYLYIQFLLIISLGATLKAQTPVIDLNFTQIDSGMWLSENPLPDSSVVGDSKVNILKIDPHFYKFELITSSQYGKPNKTAAEWANKFDLNVAFNAGMYNLKNGTTNKGYLKNYKHFNNSVLSKSLNIVMAFNPKDSSDLPFKLFDLSCDSFSHIQNRYNSISQIMRMVDCNGVGLDWSKRAGQKCSMIFISSDIYDNIYVVFVRSPYTHNYMIKYLLSLPIKMRCAGYLEGGPETSLYINCNTFNLEKWGSYVSKTYETDKNNSYWTIPNIIGIKKR